MVRKTEKIKMTGKLNSFNAVDAFDVLCAHGFLEWQ